jgi:hypothetical protein
MAKSNKRLSDLEKSMQPETVIGVFYADLEENPKQLVKVAGVPMTLEEFRAIPGSVLLRVIRQQTQEVQA